MGDPALPLIGICFRSIGRSRFRPARAQEWAQACPTPSRRPRGRLASSVAGGGWGDLLILINPADEKEFSHPALNPPPSPLIFFIYSSGLPALRPLHRPSVHSTIRRSPPARPLPPAFGAHSALSLRPCPLAGLGGISSPSPPSGREVDGALSRPRS